MRNGTDGATKAIITELRPLGMFATWQAAAGNLGIMTATRFACASIRRGEPANLEPGMTVWIEN